MSMKGLICRQKMRFSRHQAEPRYRLGTVSITQRWPEGDQRRMRLGFYFFFSVSWSKPFLESMWNVIALLTPIFSLSGSGEELHWLIIAGMKGALTLSTERLAAFSAAHYTGSRQLLERGRISSELLPGQPARKGFSSSSWDITKQLRQWRKQLGGRRRRVYQNIVSTHLKGSRCAKTALPQAPELNSDLRIFAGEGSSYRV